MFRQILSRLFVSATTPKVTEALLRQKLQNGFPKASDIKIQDISGGCGAMFEIYIESLDFQGMSRVKQHQLVNSVLAAEVKKMHGIRISTAVAPPSPSISNSTTTNER